MSRLARSPLTALRIEAGYKTALKAAKALGVSRLYVHEIEQGRGIPSDELVRRMAAKFSTSQRRIRSMVVGARIELLKRQLKELKKTT